MSRLKSKSSAAAIPASTQQATDGMKNRSNTCEILPMPGVLPSPALRYFSSASVFEKSIGVTFTLRNATAP